MPDVNVLADQYVRIQFRFGPEWGTFFGIEESDDVSLSDISADGIKAMYEAEDSLLHEVLSVDPSSLNSKDIVTYEILKESLEASVGKRVCEPHLWTINHMNAFYLWFGYIGDAQPVGDSLKREAALMRWKRIPKFIQDDMRNNQIGLEKGYALPKVSIQRVIEQMDELIASPMQDNVFFKPAARDKNALFTESLKKIVTDEIMPSIRVYRSFLNSEYMPKARTELSILSVPNGVECYSALLRSATTLTVTPEQVFSWGQLAVSTREKKVIEIGERVYGFHEIGAIKNAFKKDRSNYFSGKDALMKEAQLAIDRARSKVPEYFGILPKADVVLEPIPPMEEKSGFSRYVPASDDGKRAAKYIQQTYEPEMQTHGHLESTAFHETYPGHHLQIAISQELLQAHPITKYTGNSGFSEGWARYTESLSDEMGLYSSEKSRLAMYMGLPTGMVVDPGIHFKNWTREEAITYVLQKQSGETRSSAERYVDRISVMPGQMATYGVGEMYFINLRQRAEKALGAKFDIKSFHDECLKNGGVPLNFITGQIETWIEKKKISE